MKRSLLLSIVVSTAAVAIGVGVAGASSGNPSTARATTVKAASSSLGRILVDAKGRTLYLFEKDARGRSSCSGACALAWPPLVTSGKPSGGKGARASLLGVTRHADLYGAGWYALTPAGTKIDDD